jgi:hypothetical protein
MNHYKIIISNPENGDAETFDAVGLGRGGAILAAAKIADRCGVLVRVVDGTGQIVFTR